MGESFTPILLFIYEIPARNFIQPITSYTFPSVSPLLENPAKLQSKRYGQWATLSLLNWTYHGQGKNMEGIRHCLFCATLELENTRQAVQEELKKRDEQLTNLKELLDKTVWERNEAQNNCRRLLLQKFLMQQQVRPAPISGISSIEDEPGRGIHSSSTFSSSNCEESIVSSPGIETVQPQKQPAPICATESTLELVPTTPMPEKDKILQAVLRAGPLLQTLLLAGPLPQWRHPPPPVTSTDIPPARIPSSPRPLTPPPAFFSKTQ